MPKRQCNNSEVRAEQATNPVYENIYLGSDLHKKSITVTWIIDGATPEAARRFSWERFWQFIGRQKGQARQLHAVYEAGAFGFWPCRQLQELGFKAWVVHPEKLDPRQRRVQNDRLDCLQLALKLERYVGGNRKAMTPVYVPTPAEELDRMPARHRDHLSQQIHALQARGRGLLLSQGIFDTRGWYRAQTWEALRCRLNAGLAQILEDLRQSMEQLTEQLRAVEQALEKSAPAQLPKGFGKLTFVMLLRLLCNYQRFKSGREVAGFSGLCGGVSASGDYHWDLSINKAGSPRLRALLIEWAWRMIYSQPNYRGLATWKRLGGPAAAQRRRKIALVATARQVLVDVWKWQNGLITPEQLGWTRNPTA